MRFKQRKELADKYREWVKQTIDNNQTMILDCVESVIAFLDINGYLNEAVRCKDCKYYLCLNEKCKLIDTRLHFYETDNTWTEDAFCAWGERKEQ